MNKFFSYFLIFFIFGHIIMFGMTSAKNVILKNINKHIDMKNLQIIKNFGFKSSNIARLFDRAIELNHICIHYCFNSFNMLEIAGHRTN